jgi:hypothetical protein
LSIENYGEAQTAYAVTVIWPTPGFRFAALIRQPVGVEPSVSGWGRLERTMISAPPLTELIAPPPVATSPGLHSAGVDNPPFVERVFPVRTVTAPNACKPIIAASTCSSNGLQAVRTLSAVPSRNVPVAGFRPPQTTAAHASFEGRNQGQD